MNKFLDRLENIVSAVRTSRFFNADFRIFLAALLFILLVLSKILFATVVEIHVPTEEEIANEYKDDYIKEEDQFKDPEEETQDESVFANETLN